MGFSSEDLLYSQGNKFPLARLKLYNPFTAYSSFFLLRILGLRTTLLLNKVFDPFAQHSLLK